MDATNRTCNRCNHVGPETEFAGKKNICNACNRKAVARTRQKARGGRPLKGEEVSCVEMKIDKPKVRKVSGSATFDNRDVLNETLKVNLQQALDHANALVSFSQARLEAARVSGNPTLIKEAQSALDKALAGHQAIVIKLTDKLEMLDSLRLAETKSKPAVFYFNEYPPSPNILPTRQIPVNLRPETDA